MGRGQRALARETPRAGNHLPDNSQAAQPTRDVMQHFHNFRHVQFGLRQEGRHISAALRVDVAPPDHPCVKLLVGFDHRRKGQITTQDRFEVGLQRQTPDRDPRVSWPRTCETAKGPIVFRVGIGPILNLNTAKPVHRDGV